MTNADKVLVYNRPLGLEGLRWQELLNWWRETQSIDDPVEAKKSLYRRLQSCLPDSPPQRLLFEAYFAGFKSAIPNLPALLPEVWLHWDPKTNKERGRDALLYHRMDFLLLLPQSVRVVIEVDGKHHYADGNGTADPSRYAGMARSDRELKLSGYEVYRFGAAELQSDTDKAAVIAFFKNLFAMHRIPIA